MIRRAGLVGPRRRRGRSGSESCPTIRARARVSSRPRSRTRPGAPPATRRTRGRSSGSLARHDEHQRLERGGDRPPRPLRRGDRGRLDVVHQHLDRRAADEHALARQQPVGDAAEPVEVDARVDRLPAERGLGRHVGRGSGDRALGGQVIVVAHGPGGLDQAEVEHLDEVPLEAPVARQDVRRLDVAVDRGPSRAPRPASRRPGSAGGSRARAAPARSGAPASRGRARRAAPSRSRTPLPASRRSRGAPRCARSAAPRSPRPRAGSGRRATPPRPAT